MTTERGHYLACRQCESPAYFVNAGRTHIGYCIHCQIRWDIGSNLFSSWRDETEEQQRAAWEAAGIDHMRWVGANA